MPDSSGTNVEQAAYNLRVYRQPGVTPWVPEGEGYRHSTTGELIEPFRAGGKTKYRTAGGLDENTKVYNNIETIKGGPGGWMEVGVTDINDGDVIDMNSWLQNAWPDIRQYEEIKGMSPEQYLASGYSNLQVGQDGNLVIDMKKPVQPMTYEGNGKWGDLMKFASVAAIAFGGVGALAGALGGLGAGAAGLFDGAGLAAELGASGLADAAAASSLGGAGAGAGSGLTNAFTNSFVPTLTGTTAPSVVASTAPLADLAATLGTGGQVGVGGVGTLAQTSALEAALGTDGLAGGGTSGLGALTDILQTGGSFDIGPITNPPTGDGTQPPAPVEHRTQPGPIPGTTEILDKLPGVSTVTDLIKTVTGTGTGLTDLLKTVTGGGDLSWLGTLLSTIIGMKGANEQTKALTDIANQARADRLPALNAFNTALTNPNSWYQSAPAMGATDSALKAASVSAGNPALNPNALSKVAAYNLGGYNDFLGKTGSLGLSGQASTLAAQTNAINASDSMYGNLQSGLASLLTNKNINSFADLFKNSPP